MTNLIRAELLKIRTTRTVYGLLAAALALVAVTVLATLGQSQTRELDVPLIDRDLLFIPWIVLVVFVLVLGLRSYTDEFRHASIVPTLLATPDRQRVLAAKLVAITVWSLLFTAAAYALTFAIVLPGLASAGMSTSIAPQAVAALLGKAALTSVLWAVARRRYRARHPPPGRGHRRYLRGADHRGERGDGACPRRRALHAHGGDELVEHQLAPA